MGEKNTELKRPPWVWSDLAVTVGKVSTVLPWRNRSKLKLRVSPREKLISNSQSCPVSGRGWWLIIYQPLWDQFWKPACSRGHTPLRKHKFKHPELSPQRCLIGRSSTHCHATQYTNLEGQCWKALIKNKSVTTSTRSQRKESRTSIYI
jgi:hypothetical protein